jgi:hypothetical protein
MNNAITRAAAPGTRCAQCLCCDAEIVVDLDGKREALCAACDDGTHPELTPHQPHPPALGRAPLAMPGPKPEKEAPMGKRSSLTPEQIRAIRDAGYDETALQLGERLGVSAKIIEYQRRNFGKKPPAPRGRKSSLTPEQMVAIGDAGYNESARAIGERLGVSAKIVDSQRRRFGRSNLKAALEPANGPKFSPVHDPMAELALPRSASITLSVPEKTLDAWWASLDLDGKAALFTANYKFRIEGTIS